MVELGIGSGAEGEPPITNYQLYVAKGEGSGVGWRICTFSWTKEEEECNDDHVCGGSQVFGVMREILGNKCNAADD